MTDTNTNTNVKTSLSNQGYALYKNKFTEKEIESIKNDLTIKTGVDDILKLTKPTVGLSMIQNPQLKDPTISANKRALTNLPGR